MFYLPNASNDPRTKEDKQKAVKALLSDPKLIKLTNTEISRICGVSRQYVRNIRVRAVREKFDVQCDNMVSTTDASKTCGISSGYIRRLIYAKKIAAKHIIGVDGNITRKYLVNPDEIIQLLRKNNASENTPEMFPEQSNLKSESSDAEQTEPIEAITSDSTSLKDKNTFYSNMAREAMYSAFKTLTELTLTQKELLLAKIEPVDIGWLTSLETLIENLVLHTRINAIRSTHLPEDQLRQNSNT